MPLHKSLFYEPTMARRTLINESGSIQVTQLSGSFEILLFEQSWPVLKVFSLPLCTLEGCLATCGCNISETPGSLSVNINSNHIGLEKVDLQLCIQNKTDTCLPGSRKSSQSLPSLFSLCRFLLQYPPGILEHGEAA